MKKFFSTEAIWYNEGLFVVRLIFGFFMAYHGWEIFNKELMDGYVAREEFKKIGSPVFMTYFGKAAELLAGVLLILGYMTRVGAILAIGTMAFIALIVGHGIVWYNDQHPFLFVLLGLVFIFTGPGCYSLDAAREIKKEKA